MTTKKLKIYSIIFALLLIALIFGGIYYFQKNKSSTSKKDVVVTSQTSTKKPPRNMTQDTFDQLNSVLHKDKSKKIEVIVIDGDTEALGFANQIKDYLVKLGYKADGVNKKTYEKDWIGANIVLAPDKSVKTIIVGRQL